MSERTLTFDGLDELAADFKRVRDRYPDETVKEIYRLGGVFYKDVNSKFPSEYKNGKRPLDKEWHRTRVKGLSGATVEVEVENTAPHFHLVENGHELVYDPKLYAAYSAGKLDKSKGKKRSKAQRSQNLKSGGFVPGKHYCENTRDEWNNGKFAGHVREYLDKMLAENNL